MPARCATVPVSQGSPAPPTTDAAFMTPMEVGASRAGARPGATAMVVGKTGPRKKPSSTSATVATTGAGDSQASVAAVTPARQAYIRPAVVAPILAAAGLIRNRPRVRPSQ